MSNWVISSNPTTTYRAAESLEANDGVMDWISRNKFQVGDTVYIYEAKSGGRGGIVFKTRAIETGLSLETKIDDKEYWIGDDYPDYITRASRFNRLKLIELPINGIIPYKILKEKGFTAPQAGVIMLDKKPGLLSFIKECFA